MALWSIDIEKRLGSEFWSNRYLFSDLGEIDVATMAADLVENEREIHADLVTFTRYRYSALAEGDERYTIVPVNQPGLRTGQGTLLPLFNTLRYDLTANVGRPSRKFYRGVLGEGDINGDAVTTAPFVANAIALSTFFAEGIGNGLVDPQGGLLTGISIYPFVQMRQLRRSRRRRTNGGGIFQ